MVIVRRGAINELAQWQHEDQAGCMHARPLLRMRLMSDCAWPGGDRCNDDHGGAVVCTREGGSSRQDRHRHAQAGHIADIIELRVWPPMAGLHSAADGLLAGSGGSGCATVWHRCSATQARDDSVQVASGSASYRAGLAAMVEGRLHSSRYERLESPCGNRARGLAAAVVAITLHHGRRDVGEFWAWRVLLSCLSSAWAPRTGLWRGEESVVCAG